MPPDQRRSVGTTPSLKLTLVTADVGGSGGDADLDGGFRLSKQRQRPTPRHQAPAAGNWRFRSGDWCTASSNNQLMMSSRHRHAHPAVLVDNVSAFNVSFGLASSATDVAASSYSTNPSDPARIRSVRLTLTLTTRTTGCTIKPSTWLPLCATACHERRADDVLPMTARKPSAAWRCWSVWCSFCC